MHLLEDAERVVELLPWHWGCFPQVLHQCLPFMRAVWVLAPRLFSGLLQPASPGMKQGDIQPAVSGSRCPVLGRALVKPLW